MLLYRRIFEKPRSRIVIWAVLVACIAWLVSIFFSSIFQCYPVSKAWDATHMAPGSCIDQLSFFIASAATDLLTDVMILSLPVPMVFKLQMPLRRKLAVSGMFLLGAL